MLAVLPPPPDMAIVNMAHAADIEALEQVKDIIETDIEMRYPFLWSGIRPDHGICIELRKPGIRE